MNTAYKSLFLLDPKVVFLNHGSFGACPRPVFEAYQSWQRRLESQPVLFLGREYGDLDEQARQALAGFLHTQAENVAFIPNATYGVNLVARSLHLQLGDEVLASDHEYGACDHTWEFLCAQSGARYVHQPLPMPVTTSEDLVEQLWQGVTARTRVIFLSHITSPTALRLPVEAICRRAREAGIITLIDGAHAPGQIPLDLDHLGADFYTGNCHKWMLAPKGAAFLYTRPEMQNLIEPLVVSWGWTPSGIAGGVGSRGARYIDLLSWTGTHDPAAAFSVPAAIEFMQQHNWETVRKQCKALLTQAVERVCELTGLPPAYPSNSEFYRQMAIAPLPQTTNLEQLKARLYDEWRVEVPLTEWTGANGDCRKFVRISIQAYNIQDDIDQLLQALKSLL